MVPGKLSMVWRTEHAYLGSPLQLLSRAGLQYGRALAPQKKVWHQDGLSGSSSFGHMLQ